MNCWTLQASIQKFSSLWLFSSWRNTCVYIVCISIISPFQPRMQRSCLTNDLMPNNGVQRKYEGNILCRITSLSVMHFMSSISCIHSGRAQAPRHLYNRAERVRKRGSTLSYIFQNWNTTDSESVDGLIDFILKAGSEMSRSQRLCRLLAAANVRTVTQQFSGLHSETN